MPIQPQGSGSLSPHQEPLRAGLCLQRAGCVPARLSPEGGPNQALRIWVMNQRSYQGLSHCPVQFPSWSDWERHSLSQLWNSPGIEQLALGAYPGPCRVRYCQLPPLPRGQSPTGSVTCQAQGDQPGLLTCPRAGAFSFRNHGVPPCGSGWSAVPSTPGAAAPYIGSPRAHD